MRSRHMRSHHHHHHTATATPTDHQPPCTSHLLRAATHQQPCTSHLLRAATHQQRQMGQGHSSDQPPFQGHIGWQLLSRPQWRGVRGAIPIVQSKRRPSGNARSSFDTTLTHQPTHPPHSPWHMHLHTHARITLSASDMVVQSTRCFVRYCMCFS
jgi:hypothetical protein